MVTAVQEFTEHFHNRFPEMSEYAQNEGTIFSAAGVDGWIVNVTPVFTNYEISGRHRRKLYGAHYSKNLLEMINELHDTRCYVKFGSQARSIL